MSLVARLFRLLEHHVVVTSSSDRLALKTPEGADIRGQLPHLVIGNPAFKRRHSTRTTLNDRGKDVLRVATIDPLVVGERRTDSAATMGVTSAAVHLVEEVLAFAHRVGVVLVRVTHAGLDEGRPRLELAHNDVVGCCRRGRQFPEATLFPLTADEGGCHECGYREFPCSHVAGPARPTSILGTP